MTGKQRILLNIVNFEFYSLVETVLRNEGDVLVCVKRDSVRYVTNYKLQ